MKRLMILVAMASVIAIGNDAGTKIKDMDLVLSTVFCVDKDKPNATILAKAMGEAMYISNSTISRVSQVSTSSSFQKGGEVEVEYMHHAEVSQSGVVESRIKDSWLENDKLCVDLEFI